MKKLYIFIAVLLAAVLLTAPFPASGEEDGTSDIPFDKAKAYYIGQLDSSKPLLSSDLTEKINPASTVKMMSGLILCEYYKDKTDEILTVTDDMVKSTLGSKTVGITQKYSPTAGDLLYAAFCGGYNDAVLVLACNAYGSETELVAAMNLRAKELGMTDTVYLNATGLNNSGMTTTLQDLKILAAAAYSSELLRTITSTVSYSADSFPTPFQFTNANAILTSGKYRNQKCRGLNAGMTPESGYGVVTVAENNGISYICIVMGAENDSASDTLYSYVIANKLINWAYDRYGTKVLIDTSTVICEIPVTYSVKTESVIAVPEEAVSAFLPKDYEIGNHCSIHYELFADTLEAPVSTGQKVGRVTVYCDSSAIATVALVTKTSAEKSEILEGIDKIRAFTSSDLFIGTVISCAVICFSVFTVRAFIRGSKKKRKTLK